jgi:hypothetical protein
VVIRVEPSVAVRAVIKPSSGMALRPCSAADACELDDRWVVRSMLPADDAAASFMPPSAGGWDAGWRLSSVAGLGAGGLAVTSASWRDPSVRADGKASICGEVVGLGVCSDLNVKKTPGVGGTDAMVSPPPAAGADCAGGDATTSTVMGG